jgi:hypothetical protein
MILYTEEEVRKAIELSDGRSIDEVLAGLTPIEIPSDEEIDKEAFQVPYDNTRGFYDLQFIKGAKWMRNKIQGGNK